MDFAAMLRAEKVKAGLVAEGKPSSASQRSTSNPHHRFPRFLHSTLSRSRPYETASTSSESYSSDCKGKISSGETKKSLISSTTGVASYMNQSIELKSNHSSLDIRQFRVHGETVSATGRVESVENIAIEHLYYWPDFVSHSEEESILNLINSAPEQRWTSLSNRSLQMWGGTPKQKAQYKPEPLPKWMNQVINLVVEAGVFDRHLLQNQFPTGLTSVAAEGNKPDHNNLFLEQQTISVRKEIEEDDGDDIIPNHILINRYAPGEGIMAHSDGPLYTPLVAILSLGSDVMFDIHRTLADTKLEGKELAQLYLRRRSLLVFTHDVYTKYFHSIKEVTSDQITGRVLNRLEADVNVGSELARHEVRVSMTIRHVPHV